MERLEQFLSRCGEWILPGGRLVILSFASHEDRRVKTWIRSKEGSAGEFRSLFRGVLRPAAEEVRRNRRARSCTCARLKRGKRCRRIRGGSRAPGGARPGLGRAGQAAPEADRRGDHLRRVRLLPSPDWDQQPGGGDLEPGQPAPRGGEAARGGHRGRTDRAGATTGLWGTDRDRREVRIRPRAGYRTLRIPVSQESAPLRLEDQVKQELRKGSRILLPEALAKEIWASVPVSGEAAGGRGEGLAEHP